MYFVNCDGGVFSFPQFALENNEVERWKGKYFHMQKMETLHICEARNVTGSLLT